MQSRGGAGGRARGGRGRGRHRARRDRRGRRRGRAPRASAEGDAPPRPLRGVTAGGPRYRSTCFRQRGPGVPHDRLPPPTCGWWSGWGTPARPMPGTGTTSATSSSTSSPPGWARRSAPTSPAGPTSSRDGSAHPGAEARASCCARPRCYMNETGGPVKQLATFYKVPPERIVAIHDELDIPFDTMRVKLGGGDNGHNGLRSMRSVARHRRLPPGAGRHRPPARAAGRRRLRAVQLLVGRAQGSAVPGRRRPPTPSSRWSPRASSAPSRSSTPSDSSLGLRP